MTEESTLPTGTVEKTTTVSPTSAGQSNGVHAPPRRTRKRAATPADDTPLPDTPELDLARPELYLNRELTWLGFNRRVLQEARDPRTPLLERVKFLAIVSSNLDEFFMKRIGGLKQQVGAGVSTLTLDGRTPQQQIDECYEVVRDIKDQKEALLPVLLRELATHDIRVIDYQRLDKADRNWLREYYVENIFPLVTPQAVDPAHPFPFISNLSLNLLVTLHYENDDEQRRARVKVPVGYGIPRFLRIRDTSRFVRLEEIMSANLDLLFPRMVIDSCELFHVTRNANTEHEEDRADDLLALIESEVRDRKFAPIVRLIVERSMDANRRGMLTAELGLSDQRDVFEYGGMMAMRDLFELAALDAPSLHYPPHHPIDHPKLADAANVFHAIRETGSILLHHPYESFTTSVERFLREAAHDPKVRAIKMTLYRTSSDTKVIDHLVAAARNGTQVAVAVELKAQGDEAANIRWANRLEEAGIHVTYGVVGLKTHCKVILAVRYDYDGLRRYAHIGTGNYHAGTARLYTDLGLLTCDPEICGDLTELFNYLTTGFTPTRHYRRILPAPKLLKRALLGKIRREIDKHTPENPGLIQFKINALEDADITRALYRAAHRGVRVDLIVRDTCRLRPGLEGLSESVRVVSIVGRFLEHSRIYYFRNGGEEEYYIGSADAMMRNLEHRVEVLAPVEDAQHRSDLRLILDTCLNDQRSAWDMQSDGSYIQRESEQTDASGTQDTLCQWADGRMRSSRRLRKRKAQGIGRRNIRPVV